MVCTVCMYFTTVSRPVCRPVSTSLRTDRTAAMFGTFRQAQLLPRCIRELFRGGHRVGEGGDWFNRVRRATAQGCNGGVSGHCAQRANVWNN